MTHTDLCKPDFFPVTVPGKLQCYIYSRCFEQPRGQELAVVNIVQTGGHEGGNSKLQVEGLGIQPRKGKWEDKTGRC